MKSPSSRSITRRNCSTPPRCSASWSRRAAATPSNRPKRRSSHTLKLRHDGEDDVTVITQDAVLATFDRILRALTLGVSGIAAISLAVAGILVMNVMLVAVAQRTSEIGLLKAIGAPSADIRRLFFAEALWLSLAGGAIGFALGHLRRLADPARLSGPACLATGMGQCRRRGHGAHHRHPRQPAARLARGEARSGQRAERQMSFADTLRFALHALTAHRCAPSCLRSASASASPR